MTISLSKIALDFMADKRSKYFDIPELEVTEAELIRYADSIGLRGYLDLIITANNIVIDNRFDAFEERVVLPIKRVQGIYF